MSKKNFDPKDKIKSNPVYKSLNRSYLPEEIINEDLVNSLFSIFNTADEKIIKEKIFNYDNLNFKNKDGQTLIQALINNSITTLTENNKISIINDLLL